MNNKEPQHHFDRDFDSALAIASLSDEEQDLFNTSTNIMRGILVGMLRYYSVSEALRLSREIVSELVPGSKEAVERWERILDNISNAPNANYIQ